MILKNVKVLEFRGEEKSGVSARDGETYRSRVAEISWPDEEGGKEQRTIARLQTEALNQWDERGLYTGLSFDAQAEFVITHGKTGYKFANCFITNIL